VDDDGDGYPDGAPDTFERGDTNPETGERLEGMIKWYGMRTYDPVTSQLVDQSSDLVADRLGSGGEFELPQVVRGFDLGFIRRHVPPTDDTGKPILDASGGNYLRRFIFRHRWDPDSDEIDKCNWPYLIRIRYRVHDPRGKLADPVTAEPGVWFEQIIRVNRGT
jgi:hypothetical protein